MAVKRTPVPVKGGPLQSTAGEGTMGAGIEMVWGDSGLDSVYRECDAIVLAAPDTPKTRGMIDADALTRMKSGVIILNVARGRLIDENALIEALSRGRIRGAGLDVFTEEPLPSDSPLWALKNTVITPHVSAVTRGFWKRETDLILRNLSRYMDDSPLEEWENVVNKKEGY